MSGVRLASCRAVCFLALVKILAQMFGVVPGGKLVLLMCKIVVIDF